MTALTAQRVADSHPMRWLVDLHFVVLGFVAVTFILAGSRVDDAQIPVGTGVGFVLVIAAITIPSSMLIERLIRRDAPGTAMEVAGPLIFTDLIAVTTIIAFFATGSLATALLGTLLATLGPIRQRRAMANS